MPSVRYFNQTAPFWDFVAGLEEQGQSHPFAQHRSREGAAGPSHPGRQQSSDEEGDTPPEAEKGPADDGERKTTDDGDDQHPHCGKGRSGWGHRGRGGGHRGRGAWRQGGCGRGPAWGTRGGPFGMGPWGQFIQSQFMGENREESSDQDWSPAVDVFDTESSFVIHASLAGAKKEDIAVSWDAEKSELIITGIIQRPGDEEFLQTLALDERKVGTFERKVRLGSRANPALVDADGITAKLEDGVLRVEVPKEDKDYVDVKKVDVQ